MRVLLVKLSSLGDVVHSFPALTDVMRAIPDLTIDWVVDEAFAPLARLHPAVRKVIALPIRRLKKAPRATFAEARARIADLRSEHYDILIDAQGLVKSALVDRLARASSRHGFGRGSAREGLATLAYTVGHDIPETEHMATRIRRLFAAALGYPMPEGPAAPGLDPKAIIGNAGATQRQRVVLIHGTSWKTKTWTVDGWRTIATRAGETGRDVVLFAHGKVETGRAEAIARGLDHVHLEPPAGLDAIIPRIAAASAVVTVDTGLGHLAAAFGIPTVGLYGPTNPGLTGLVGPHVVELVAGLPCAPCEQTQCRIKPDFGEGPPCLAGHAAGRVWNELVNLIEESGGTI
ncbi:lipopolysaccharide heptosyltransferase I [Kaistia dalseonensis]|uniref:Lipopolysaccharide heptosyltransferase 1 n=1 Tax=Kaistia dalseonensis TaxID=410840 RepID=A0ABU0H2D5_9HYPH|nr:lipopolysaccharide heptosyltransferase I [Kaistia dalseonensis]MCX5493650.1 lipopolysaccharide heptosyltransferase I [Kaistia dalseonensis]MDQ0436212.1 heptosyltransferase-1 [Kaistia dalseonensis]